MFSTLCMLTFRLWLVSSQQEPIKANQPTKPIGLSLNDPPELTNDRHKKLFVHHTTNQLFNDVAVSLKYQFKY